MGRYYWDKKNTVEDSTKLSIFKLKEFGLLVGCCHTRLTWTRSLSGHKSSIGIVVNVLGEPYVKLNYSITDRNSGEKTDYDYKVQLTTTPCNFGGVRYWFICPLSRNGIYCGRRTGTLYLASGGKYFGCRHCYNLSYESRNESRLGWFGQWGYILKAERQYEELYNKTKRWTWSGKPTRKAKKLHILEQKMNRAASLSKMFLD
ncbi:MAG: hypothetical protein A2169_15810 [Deltaproteobacteria bacterium RBG_13_47_9]|nr:MAG: hypothetical protein A2169_15810 [Deltaproteobacteria bacterium RBG_13_47_9]